MELVCERGCLPLHCFDSDINVDWIYYIIHIKTKLVFMFYKL